MGRLFRGVIRVFVLFVVASVLFGIGSAMVAALTKRRVQTTEDPASNEPTAASVFAGERFVSRAPALHGGRVITWFGGHDVDLRDATLDPSGATLDLKTVYGGTQVAVPEGWRVRSHVTSIFGGTEVGVPEADLPADAPLLELRGFTLFGGVRVTTNPVAPWSVVDDDGDALPPMVEVSEPAVDVAEPAVDVAEPADGVVAPTSSDGPVPA
jgi:Cell wall-active antibiotics response 4TMS YvqF